MKIETREHNSIEPKSVQSSIPEFRRVLVTTDLSDLGNRAIAYAYSAVEPGGTVQIVHVEKPFEFVNPLHAHHPMMVQRLEEEREEQITECRDRIRKLVPEEAQRLGVTTEIEVLHEDKPAIAICQAAERFGAELICMASHGRSGLFRAVLGSVTQLVLTMTDAPLLVIRAPRSTKPPT